MALVPLSGTDIRLLSGVPFSNDYKHTRWFDTKTEQTNYFLAKPLVHSMSQSQFQRVEGRTFIKVNASVDELRGTNYVMFRNTSYNAKWFYAFVTQLEYKQEKTTYVYFDLDVLQTWMFDITFKPSYIVREHCPLWNSDGTPVINTQDEGLNYGTEYETVSVDNWKPFDDLYFLVIVCKSAVETGANNQVMPNINGMPQPLSYYVHPFRMNNTYPIIHVDSQDVNIGSILDVLKSLYTNTKTVNDIVSLYITDYIGAGLMSYDGSILTLDDTIFDTVNVSDGTNSFLTLKVVENQLYSTTEKSFGDKYTGFNTVSESKLLMHPYTVTIVDDFKGNRITIKNEYIEYPNLNIQVLGSMGTSNKVAYQVKNYLLDPVKMPVDQDGVSLEHALINNNPNDVPILSDYLSAFLQGHRNSIENQKDTILFNGIMDSVGGAIGGIASGLTGNGVGVGSSISGLVKGAGNSVLQMQGIQAKMKDISNTPPGISKMGSNTAFDYGNGYNGVYVIKKQITSEYRKKLTDFFNMFGYKLNEVKIPNFHTRQNWNFVQTKACNITGNLNNEDLQELKTIFDGGITLWHTDDIGNYDLGNGVI